MKRTIIALMALTGIATATDVDTTPITLSADFTSSIAAVCPDNASYAVTINSLKTGENALGNKTEGNYFTDDLRPNLNMNTGNAWTLKFTLENNSNSAITLNSVVFDAFIFNGSGNQHGADQETRQAQFTLTDASSNVLGTTDVTFCKPNSAPEGSESNAIWNTDMDAGITLSSAVELAAGESIQFNLTVGRGNLTNPGAFVGLKGVTFNGSTPLVPEPTTATLSLLALAGLATRRRRK